MSNINSLGYRRTQMNNMIDLGQYISRAANPLRFSWSDVRCPHPRQTGDLCVIRSSNGTPEILKIEDSAHWREWAGAFSYISEGVTA